ncbi:molybdopterin synthase sulfur carrier subunit [mine drainage metagenome]|uniref:Molybdopterin synthase sulfur carrier subunit n=1 Tax=mine drainage metagenome TaxID=410659 RepID=A0A1J5PZG8_9ZZZZ
MKITVRYFARVREEVGTSLEQHEVPEWVETLGALRDWLSRQSRRHAQALAPELALRTACDRVMGDTATALRAGCEVAFFPPVTGG